MRTPIAVRLRAAEAIDGISPRASDPDSPAIGDEELLVDFSGPVPRLM